MMKLCGSLAVLLGVAMSLSTEAASVTHFRLLDVNPNSVRSKSLVSPRDYLLQVSGYYFGEAG
jgi:hypothetical protein